MIGYSALEGFDFVPHKNHAGCRICGRVFQSDLDRIDDPSSLQLMDAAALRTAWRVEHDKTHTNADRRNLVDSGFYLTPEAANKLAPFGVIPLSDAVKSDQIEHALLTAERAPSDDADSSPHRT